MTTLKKSRTTVDKISLVFKLDMTLIKLDVITIKYFYHIATPKNIYKIYNI